MLKAVIFDLDDTLIDWSGVEAWPAHHSRQMSSLLDYVRRCGHPLDDIDTDFLFSVFMAQSHLAWTRSNETLRAPSLLAMLIETLKTVGVPEETLDPADLADAFDWQPAPGERAYPDVFEVLPQLKAHGIATGIITNASTPMSWRDRELAATGLLDLFPTCRLAAVDVGVIKPHPGIFERGLAILGARPDEAVFVGDSLKADMCGAHNAGLYGVWCVRRDELLAQSADVVPDGTIRTLHELLPLLDGWYPGWRNGHSA